MTLSEIMRERRAASKVQLDELLAAPVAEKRDLTTDEDTAVEALFVEIRKQDERIAELDAQEVREAAAAASRVANGATGEQRTSDTKVTDAPVYAKGNYNQSYFRDLGRSQVFGDRDAAERLQRYGRMVDGEQRALGNTNTTGGSGGEFAPPEWLVSDFIALARPMRTVADMYKRMDIPAGVSSINLPKLLTGTTVALQSTQNTALSQTDLTTGSVGTGISTVGGKQVVSQQLLDQSGIPFDQVVTADLAAAYAVSLDTQVISGAGTGVNNNSVVNGLLNAVVPAGNQITFTSASPTAALFYSKANGALAAFATNRFAQPTSWLMHPRRWFWLMAQVDTQGRPLVVPQAVAYNPIGENQNPVGVSGSQGNFLGLPVYLDPLLPTNLGVGTNQDRVYLLKTDDLWLAESTPRAEVFRETYADSVGVLFRLFSYVGTILNRQTASIAYIDGTGLTAPVF